MSSTFLADIAANNQQSVRISLFSFMIGSSIISKLEVKLSSGTGNLAGYFVGSLDLIEKIPFIGTNLRGTFICGILVLMTTITATCLATKEIPLPSKKGSNCQILSFKSSSKRVVPFCFLVGSQSTRGITRMPKAMKRICVVQFFTWYYFETCLIFRFLQGWGGLHFFFVHNNLGWGKYFSWRIQQLRLIIQKEVFFFRGVSCLFCMI